MALARWQANIVDDAGNVLPGAQVTVRREESGQPLTVLFTDRDGLVPAGNPVSADPTGYVFFHVAGGSYRIDAVAGSFTRTWRYVAIGMAAESDALATGIRYRFSSSITDADPGAGLFKFNSATLTAVTQIFIDDESTDAVDMQTLIDTFDDGGSTLNRGTILLEQVGSPAFFFGLVTGSVTDAAGYKKLSVTHLASSGAFVTDTVTTIAFFRSGTDGQNGDVLGPDSPATTVGELALFTDTAGKRIGGSGKTINTVGAGKQTIWVPATAMYKTTADAGPSSGQLVAIGSNVQYLAFDAGSTENAYFNVAMPKSWDEGQISAQFYWMHPATVTNFTVVWQLFAIAYGNDDAMSGTPFSATMACTDTGGTTSDVYISPESSFVTVGNSPAEGDVLNFVARRAGGDGSDNLAVDAFLIGVKIIYSTNANTDD